MEKNIKSFLLIGSLTLTFVACKKKEMTTAEKVLGTWQMKTDIYHENVSGVEYSDTTYGMGQTIEFRSNNKFYSNFGGQMDSSSYSLSGDTKLIINGTDTLNINTLTSNKFVLYTRTMQGADFNEETITLTK